MRIAIPYENGNVYGHFGHTAEFRLYDAENGKIVSEQPLPAEGEGHGALAGLLKEAGVQVLICGGIGSGAQLALQQAGIRLCAGISGDAKAAAEAFLSGTLQYDPAPHCDHHEHHHGTCGHGTCGHGSCADNEHTEKR